MSQGVNAASTPNPKTALLVGLAFAALLGAYLLGRASPPATEPADRGQSATSAPDPAATESTPQRGVAGPIADLGGSGELIAEITFGPERRALVLCRQNGSSSQQRLFVSLLDTTVEPPALLAHNELLNAIQCGQCTVDVAEMQGEPVGLGNCATFVQRGAFENAPHTSMAFVIAEPPAGIVSAVGVVVDCGVTELTVEGDDLLLQGHQPNLSAWSALPNPPIRFARRGARFEANDLPLLRHYCNAAGSQQLFGYLSNQEFGYSDQRELAYLQADSDLGAIGFRRQVLIALTPAQCNALYETQNERRRDAGSATLADVTGLEPPDGIDDWFLTCQIDN